MFRIIYESAQEWPDQGALHVNVPVVSVEIAVAPDVAQRRANAYLGLDVGLLLAASDPLLVLGARPVWRLTINLHFPHTSNVGPVGTLDVDAITGDVMALSSDQAERLRDRVSVLARRFTPETAPAV